MEQTLEPPPVALSIAGHDPGSGAGVTADLKTFAAHGIFGISAITALTVQSTLGVAAVEPVSARVLRQVLLYLDADMPPEGVKIGMLGSAEAAGEVALFLHGWVRPKSHIPIVFDPVLASSSGASLLLGEGLSAIREALLPEVGWVTPNWEELSALTQRAVSSPMEAEAAAEALARRYPHLSIVVTGGDQAKPTDLLRLPGGEVHLFAGERVETRSTHGTGCAFSSALLSQLMLGEEPVSAVSAAKKYVEEALKRAPGLGRGQGPLHLLWPLTGQRQGG